ncbi:MAG: methyltransferase domain-containing protein [Trueperaceae bacterium]
MEATYRPERMVHGGRALARDTDGRVVLLHGAIPGETVRAEVRTVAGVAQGAVTEVLEADPDRIPPGPHPGLDLGFVRYERQLRLKAEVLRDAAHRAGVALPSDHVAVEPSPRTWGYRGGVQPAVRDGRLGYRREGSDELVVLDNDPTANAALQRAWTALEQVGLPAGVVEVALRGNDAGEALAAFVATVPDRELLDLGHALVRAGLAGVAVAPWDARGRFRSGKSRLAGKREIRQRFGEIEASVSATAFAQPNPEAAGAAYRALTRMTPGGDHACDLFAGSGLIGMHLADRYQRVTAVEVSHESVTRGRRDAERLGLEGRLTFVRGDARKRPIPGAELLAVDPPRAGLSKPLRRAISASGAKVLAYMACDVATWARDAADLTAHGWRLAEVRPFDFLPHTHHLELVSRFER